MAAPDPVRIRLAAGNNARWCGVVCATHGIAGRWATDAWTSATRTPPLYPDAVTLEARTSGASLLARLDRTAPGCTVKDSFADVDLSGDGFRILFDAHWIWRAAQAGASPWRAVETDVDLQRWEAAWGRQSANLRLFRPALLGRADVVVLAEYAGREVLAGAVATRSAAVVGLSNLFSRSADILAPWSAAVAAISTWGGGLPIVGYEQEPSLSAALSAGFETIGALRVWIDDRSPIR